MRVWLWALAAWAEGGVVINEVVPDAAGSDAGGEWVELLGVDAAPVELTGWTVQRATQPGSWSTVFELPEGTWIAPGERLVLAGPEADGIDGEAILWLVPGAELGNAGSSSDAVALVNAAGTAVDVVVYGSSNGPGALFVDEEGVPIETDRLAPSPKSGLALARVPDGLDTGSGTDLVRQDPTPGAPNASPDAPAEDCMAAQPGDVLLNELLADPEGGDAGAEWVELRSHLNEALPLAGWTLQTAGRPADWGSAARTHSLTGLVLPAGGHVVRADDGERPLSLGNAQDALRLVDCEGTEIDAVVYGGQNPDGFTDAAEEPLPDDAVAPALRSGLPLARRLEGVDSDDHAADWQIAAQATPGEPNPSTSCDAGHAVAINELMPDTRGPDAVANDEWVELFAAEEAVNLAGWQLLRQTSGSAAPSGLHTFGSSDVVPAGGWWVVGGANAPADAVVPVLDLPSGSGADALILVDCDGMLVDSVLFGGANNDRLAEDDGDVPAEVAPDPAEGQCVARDDDGLDSQRSADDFVTTSRCTPGAPNRKRHRTDDEPEEALPVGCGADARIPRGSAPSSGGCALSAVPSLPGLLLVGLLRRRVRGSADRPPGCSGSLRS